MSMDAPAPGVDNVAATGPPEVHTIRGFVALCIGFKRRFVRARARRPRFSVAISSNRHFSCFIIKLVSFL
jgi:hypothetical protein